MPQLEPVVSKQPGKRSVLISTLRGLIVSLVCSHQGGTLHIQVCGVTLCPSHALSGNDRYNPYPSAFIQYLIAMKEQLGVPPSQRCTAFNFW